MLKPSSRAGLSWWKKTMLEEESLISTIFRISKIFTIFKIFTLFSQFIQCWKETISYLLYNLFNLIYLIFPISTFILITVLDLRSSILRLGIKLNITKKNFPGNLTSSKPKSMALFYLCLVTN